jgi:succinate dehydrogenase/fumarate reductase cytochrome b subunit
MANENTNRNVFGLHGVTGMIIATVLLLTILVVLTMWAIAVQKDSATKYYDASSITGSLTNVKANSVDNAKHSFIDAK